MKNIICYILITVSLFWNPFNGLIPVKQADCFFLKNDNLFLFYTTLHAMTQN